MNGNSVTILLVEDNEVDVEAIQRGFMKQRLANPIQVARDGLEALDMLRDPQNPFPHPFLVLLDLNMPRMSGIEFLREIRADQRLKSSIIFVLTTSKADEDKMASYDLNVAGYMVKRNVGKGFIKLASMLDHYRRVVEFPDQRTPSPPAR